LPQKLHIVMLVGLAMLSKKFQAEKLYHHRHFSTADIFAPVENDFESFHGLKPCAPMPRRVAS
jgi:hypothetical protein